VGGGKTSTPTWDSSDRSCGFCRVAIRLIHKLGTVAATTANIHREGGVKGPGSFIPSHLEAPEGSEERKKYREHLMEDLTSYAAYRQGGGVKVRGKEKGIHGADSPCVNPNEKRKGRAGILKGIYNSVPGHRKGKQRASRTEDLGQGSALKPIRI